MRLRLRIERNALPSTQAIWPVKESKSTIAQLLQHINEVFPLEGDEWGLEDYTVTVGGYECLHYHELGAVCRDEDEVVIRPLEYVDVRARTMTGRDQIAADGRHLVDGVPFGKPCLKGPIRPQVRIPPRKKRRLLEDTEAEPEPLMITQAGEGAVENEDKDDDESDDEDFDEDESEDSDSSDDSSSGESEESEGSSESSSDSDSSSDDSGTSSESESDEESWSGIPGSNQTTPKSQTETVLPNGTGPRDSPSPTAGSKRKREYETEDPKEPPMNTTPPGEGKAETMRRNHRRRDMIKLKKLKAANSLPPDADLATLREWEGRNRKRKADADGDAHAGAASNTTKKTRASFSAGNERVKRIRFDSEVESPTQPQSEGSPGQKSSDDADSAPNTNKPKKRFKRESNTIDSTTDPFEEDREKLLADIASGGIEVHAKSGQSLKGGARGSNTLAAYTEGPSEDASSMEAQQTHGAEEEQTEPDGVGEKTNIIIDASTSARRVQLDIAGSKRLLFGSLGVRVPKTQEDKDRTQKKLADRPKRNANAVDLPKGRSNAITENGTSSGAAALNETVDAEEEPDAWRDKVNLTAVECCDEGIELAEPPFPFFQRWDPQYHKRKKNRNSAKYQSQKRNRNYEAEYVETYDKYNIGPNGDALEYDDVGAGEEYWEDGALLGDDVEADAEAEAEHDDGFPAVPAKLDDLRQLSANEAQKGDFIAFQELACEESTGWQPKMVTRTAKVVDLPADTAAEAGGLESSWTIQLASRDLKPKVFDEEGNRVYSKFEMPGTDAEDEGLRGVSWAELGEVRLVLRPEIEVSAEE